LNIVEKALTEKLELAAQEIIDALLPKYKAEFEATLEKVANRLAKGMAKDLVIEDKGTYLSVTLNTDIEKKT
jgi:hypothetical protein